MKKVTAYRSDGGKIYDNLPDAVADDLWKLFSQGGDPVSLNHGDIKTIVKEAAKVVSILRQLDGVPMDGLDPRYFHKGHWDCEGSPTKQCIYTTFDSCIFCGAPEERK